MLDRAVRVSVPAQWVDLARMVLFDLLGPFEVIEEGDRSHLIFYPFRQGLGFVRDEEIRSALPEDPSLQDELIIERLVVPPGWEDSWKDFFQPLKAGRLYLRPPWAEPAPPDLLDVVINPGLAFGTGHHATTRGVLQLLQENEAVGPLLDVGTGSGILAIAASKLGFSPVRAFDNDPLAVQAASTNALENEAEVDVESGDVESAPAEWLRDATVLANLTLEPVLILLGRISSLGVAVRRVLVSGILAGEQEAAVVERAREVGLRPGRIIRDEDWVTMDLEPSDR